MTARAAVVFNSFGPNYTYASGVVWGVSGSSTSGGYRGQAESFVSGISGNLNSIVLATYRSQGSGRSNFFFAEDNGGVPGSILESFPNVLNNASGLLTLNSVTRPLLQPGVRYWVCDEPADATTVNGWYQNNQGYNQGFAFERSPWSWSAIGGPAPASGVFQINATIIPEPTAAALLLAGGFLLWRMRRD